MARPDSKRSIIDSECIALLDTNPEGKRFSDLYYFIKEKYPDMADGTISGSIREIVQRNPEKVYKADKGLYKHIKYQPSVVNNANAQIIETTTINGGTISEADFYESFAIWLVEDLEECTKAIAVGGSIFKDKWGTPDVIGVLKSKDSDIIKNPLEVTSVEIKLETTQLITAFGQACAYKLFSHKVYLVIPESSPKEDLSRLDSLCSIFGIGLVTYDSVNVDNPKYLIRNRAIKNEPDYYYANRNMKIIEDRILG